MALARMCVVGVIVCHPATEAGSSGPPASSWLADPAGLARHLDISVLPLSNQSMERTVEPPIEGFLITSERD